MRDRLLRALLVWSDCEVAEAEQLRLALDGYNVTRARDLSEAAGLIRSRRPDLVFVDGKELELVDLLAGLMAWHRPYARIPVLAVQLRQRDRYHETPDQPALRLAYPRDLEPIERGTQSARSAELVVA